MIEVKKAVLSYNKRPDRTCDVRVMLFPSEGCRLLLEASCGWAAIDQDSGCYDVAPRPSGGQRSTAQEMTLVYRTCMPGSRRPQVSSRLADLMASCDQLLVDSAVVQGAVADVPESGPEVAMAEPSASAGSGPDGSLASSSGSGGDVTASASPAGSASGVASGAGAAAPRTASAIPVAQGTVHPDAARADARQSSSQGREPLVKAFMNDLAGARGILDTCCDGSDGSRRPTILHAAPNVGGHGGAVAAVHEYTEEIFAAMESNESNVRRAECLVGRETIIGGMYHRIFPLLDSSGNIVGVMRYVGSLTSRPEFIAVTTG